MSDLSLRVFARVQDPSPAFLDYLQKKENVSDALNCWVDLGIPRDFEWSEEIREGAIEYGLADEEGTILATFETLREAELAKGRAKIRFSLDYDFEEERPQGKPAGKQPRRTEIDSDITRTPAEV